MSRHWTNFNLQLFWSTLILHFCFMKSHILFPWKPQQGGCEGQSDGLFNWGLVFHQVTLMVIHGQNTHTKTLMWFLTWLFDALWLSSCWESSWAEHSCLHRGFVASQQSPGQYGDDWEGNSQAVVLGFFKGQTLKLKVHSRILLLPRRFYFRLFVCLLVC